MANKGQFQKGHEKIAGSGIKKGQKQRSSEMVCALFNFFEQKQPDLDRAWKGLNEKEKWDVYTKCLKFMAPTISSVTFEDSGAVSSIQDLVKQMAGNYKQ